MTLIGKSTIRTDGAAKVNGQVRYAIDYDLAGLLYGHVLRASIPAGRIVNIDVSKASVMPGVRAIVTAADVPETRGGWIVRDTPMFARDVVRYVGEPLAAVAADTQAQARAAAGAIKVEIEEISAITEIEMALLPDARLVHPDWKSYAPAIPRVDVLRQGNIAAQLLSEQGEVDAAFENAETVVEDEFVSNRQYQAYIESKSAVGIYQGGRFIVHTGHQYVSNVRDRISQFLDIPCSSIKIEGHTVGGAFGGKLDYGLEPFAALLSKHANGRPVKLVNTRPEDMATCGVRENTIIRIRSALDREGNILARDFHCMIDNGAYTGEIAMIPSVALHFATGVYRVAAARVQADLVYTNTPPTAAFRGVTGVAMYTAVERHMDHIANELQQDRREYRLQHLYRDGDALLNGQVLNDAGILHEGFAAVEKKAPWASLTENKKTLRGVGIGAAVWVTNSMPASVTIKLNEDGTVGVVTGACDIGSGAFTTGVVQIVAEELGIRPQDVILSMPDTDVGVYDGGSQGSRTVRMVGGAAQVAALDLRQKIIDSAAMLLQFKAEELELAQGVVRKIGDSNIHLRLADLALANTFGAGPLAATGRYGEAPLAFNPECAKGLLLPTLTSPSYHVHLAEVEVNPVTGNVKVLRYIVAQETGKVINPAAVAGQIQGSVIQGLGLVLYESLRLENGHYVENSLETYRLPLAIDSPRVEIITMEHPTADGPHGVRGVGEPAIVPVTAVIGNAISDAIGKPFHTTPITPEDVLKALEDNDL